jgi:hypothetical protein
VLPCAFYTHLITSGSSLYAYPPRRCVRGAKSRKIIVEWWEYSKPACVRLLRRPCAQGHNKLTRNWEAIAEDVLSKEKEHRVGPLPLPQLNHKKVYNKYIALKKY